MKIKRDETKEYINLGSLSYGDVFTMPESPHPDVVYMFINTTVRTIASVSSGATFECDSEHKVILYSGAQLILGRPQS